MVVVLGVVHAGSLQPAARAQHLLDGIGAASGDRTSKSDEDGGTGGAAWAQPEEIIFFVVLTNSTNLLSPNPSPDRCVRSARLPPSASSIRSSCVSVHSSSCSRGRFCLLILTYSHLPPPLCSSRFRLFSRRRLLSLLWLPRARKSMAARRSRTAFGSR